MLQTNTDGWKVANMGRSGYEIRKQQAQEVTTRDQGTGKESRGKSRDVLSKISGISVLSTEQTDPTEHTEQQGTVRRNHKYKKDSYFYSSN